MPRHQVSSQTLDLFEHVSPSPAELRIAPVKLPACGFSCLSDARLARLLGEVMTELHKRMAGERNSGPELEQVVKAATSSLERMVQKPIRSTKQRQSVRAAEPLSSVHDGQRKAIRAALAAGVAAGQVAKHFGLPLAAVRKVLSEAV